MADRMSDGGRLRFHAVRGLLHCEWSKLYRDVER